MLATRLAAATLIVACIGVVVDRVAIPGVAASPARISIDAPIARDELARQLAAPAVESPDYVATAIVRRDENVQAVLQRLSVDAGPSLARLVARDSRAQALRALRAGDELQVRYDARRQLTALVARIDDPRRSNADGARRVSVERNDRGSLTLAEAYRPYDVYWRFRSGKIKSGFFSSMSRAGVPGQIVAEAMRLFRGSIDFRKDFRPGDAFHIIYQSVAVDAYPVGVGRILAIEFQTGKKWHRAVWHGRQDRNGRPSEPGNYYAFDGDKLGAAEWIAPINVAHISSGFGTRVHPLSGQRHQHQGVDLAAPAGTPVHASASGVVEFAGWRRGYGKVVVLRHAAPYSTYYAHLSDIATGLDAGTKVRQGQRIGAVGQTGDATGAHLHFEVRMSDRPIDPMLALLEVRPSLSGEQLRAFRQSSARLVEQIARMRATYDAQATNQQNEGASG